MLEKKAKAKNYNSEVKNCIHYVQYSTTSQNANIFKLETVLKFSSLHFLLISPFTKLNFFQDLNRIQNFVKNQLGYLLFENIITFLEDRFSPKLQLLPSQKVNLDSTLFYFVIFLYFVSIKNLGGALF